jgi:Cys-rich protein (TIGR01571 family)
MSKGKTQWQFGMFGCLKDFKTCCISSCCPCIQFGLNQQHLYHKENCAPDCLKGFLAMLCFWPLFVCLECQSRAQIRKKFDIEGSVASDCASVAFCRVCSSTQEYRELLYQRDKRLYPPIRNEFVHQPQPQMKTGEDKSPSSSKSTGEHVQMESMPPRDEKKDHGSGKEDIAPSHGPRINVYSETNRQDKSNLIAYA